MTTDLDPGACPLAVAEFDRSQLPGEFRERDFVFMSSYYNTPEWKALRSQALERDNYTCQDCGSKGKEHTDRKDKAKLTAHHIIDRNSGGKDELANLKTVCGDCHRASDHPNINGLLKWLDDFRKG